MPTEDKISGEEARKVLAQIDSIEQEIAKLRATLKKGTQFNRRMELNIKIKKLEQNKDKLLGGDING
jgi:cell division protein FtsB